MYSFAILIVVLFRRITIHKQIPTKGSWTESICIPQPPSMISGAGITALAENTSLLSVLESVRKMKEGEMGSNGITTLYQLSFKATL